MHRPIPEREYATLTTRTLGLQHLAAADAEDPSTELESPPLSLELSLITSDNICVVDKG